MVTVVFLQWGCSSRNYLLSVQEFRRLRNAPIPMGILKGGIGMLPLSHRRASLLRAGEIHTSRRFANGETPGILKAFFIGLLVLLSLLPYHAKAAPYQLKFKEHFFLDPIDANLWEALKDDFQLYVPVEKPAVKAQIDWYVHHKGYLKKLVERSAPFIFYIYQQTQKRDLPAEIALLPFIESEYNPFAFSQAGATGLWQMMPGTATGFGLKIDWWYDGRRDITASTQAALDYLSYLHDFLGRDWLLAIAAYNSGEGAVREAVKRNIQHHKPADFWSLSLPKETQAYIPKLLAMIAIIQDPERYGIELPTLENAPYFTPVNIGAQIDFKEASTLSGLDIQTLHTLNPGFRRWATDPDGPFTLLIPTRKVAYFKKRLAALASKILKKGAKEVTWRHHLVATGDTLSEIAQTHHTTVKAIQASNHLTDSNIKPGEILLVPNTPPKSLLQHTSIKHNVISEDRLPGPKAIIHIVKKDETLEKIAKQHCVTTGQILFWNQLTYQHKPKSGTKLVLWKRPEHAGYKIKPGDTLSTIAEHHGITVEKLKKDNHLTDSKIVAGQSLKINPSFL